MDTINTNGEIKMEKQNIIIVGLIVIMAVLGLMVGFSMSENKALEEANAGLQLSLELIEPVIEEVIVEKEIIKEVPVEVIVEKNVSIEVPVDNGNLDIVMEFIKDEVDEDLDVEYILFEQEAKDISEAYIREEIKSLLDDEDLFDDGEVLEDYRKSEISIKKIYDVEILDRDFEDKDIELSYEVKIRAKEDGEDKEYFSFEVICPFEDGEFQDEDVELSLI